MNIEECARLARTASLALLTRDSSCRVEALERMQAALESHSEDVYKANRADMERSAADNLPAPLMKRLKFDESKLRRVCEGIRAVAEASDPVGKVLEHRELDSNLILRRVSMPIGVIGMIFESRPDALVQMASLCIRSGNAVLLKGGSEARETNRILAQVIAEATTASSSQEKLLPLGWIQNMETRDDVRGMLNLDEYIDLLIPRGSNEFVTRIMKNSSIPVLGHADGICHIYVDSSFDVQKAVSIIVDSKMQYPAACNALETLLIHPDAADLLSPLQKSLEKAGCRLKGCPRTCEILDIEPADENDWKTEYLDAVLSIRIVDGLKEAVQHINTFGSGHTDSIITEEASQAEEFMNRVDSANVFHNCSTRFADGFVFGLGAEVGISTSKIHARGPVGVDGLLSCRWELRGENHVIAPYYEGDKSFSHKEL